MAHNDFCDILLVFIFHKRKMANLDIMSHNRHILKVEGSINLVHNIQWCGFIMVQSKNQSE